MLHTPKPFRHMIFHKDILGRVNVVPAFGRRTREIDLQLEAPQLGEVNGMKRDLNDLTSQRF